MSSILASVSNLQEALQAEKLNVDIIDLKQPNLGALGALNWGEVKSIVKQLKPSSLVSATVGDLPMSPEILLNEVQKMFYTGVDYIKIGFFPEGDWNACLQAIIPFAGKDPDLVVVMFADCKPDFNFIPKLAAAGVRGIMLDTRDKSHGSLTEVCSISELKNFIYLSRRAGLLTGLAGSLNISHLPELLPLNADYLGFRGGICHQFDRTSSLDPQKIIEIRQFLVHYNIPEYNQVV